MCQCKHFVRIWVCNNVRMYVRMFVSVQAFMCQCKHLCVRASIHVSVQAFMCTCSIPHAGRPHCPCLDSCLPMYTAGCARHHCARISCSDNLARWVALGLLGIASWKRCTVVRAALPFQARCLQWFLPRIPHCGMAERWNGHHVWVSSNECKYACHHHASISCPPNDLVKYGAFASLASWPIKLHSSISQNVSLLHGTAAFYQLTKLITAALHSHRTHHAAWHCYISPSHGIHCCCLLLRGYMYPVI